MGSRAEGVGCDAVSGPPLTAFEGSLPWSLSTLAFVVGSGDPEESGEAFDCCPLAASLAGSISVEALRFMWGESVRAWWFAVRTVPRRLQSTAVSHQALLWGGDFCYLVKLSITSGVFFTKVSPRL